MNKAQLRWQEKGETVDVRPGYSSCHDDDDADDDEVMGVLDVAKCGHFVGLIRTHRRVFQIQESSQMYRKIGASVWLLQD